MRRVSLAARRARRFLRRPPPPRWRRPALIGAAAVIVLTVTAVAYDQLVRSGALAVATERVETGLLAWTAAAGLRVEEVIVVGRHRVARDQILAHLGVRAGAPILAVPPAQLRARVEDLTWVERADVARVLPRTIYVRLVERRPLALWQRDGRVDLIDHRGSVIPVAADRARLLRDWRDLRVVVGGGAAAAAAPLFATLSGEPELWADVIALTFIGERRWNVRLGRGIDVLLPEQDAAAAWRELARRSRQQGLLERAVTEVDLRFLPDRIRVRLDPAALAEEAAA